MAIFTIPNVIAGTNYTLFAFGPGAAGTFQSQALSGGGPPNTVDIPASQFSVNVAGGTTNNLGAVTWTPTRVGPTVFEIGYPDRTGAKFRHGEDYWVGDIGPSAVAPSPIWTKFLEYPFDFPNGPTYTVGQSRWTTDWNFVQPVVMDQSGNYNASTSTIQFNLATAPTNGATASLYIALASDYQGPLIVTVNGNNLGTTGGVTAFPNPDSSSGFFPAYQGSGNESDTTIREGINSVLSDERITFPASLLSQGNNTITIQMRKGGYFANHAMYDYIRLEMTGYVPPPPASVTAFAQNNCNLVCWPVTPGATSYNILRSTTSGSGYLPVTNGVVGPVCGSGWNNATWLDTGAVNGTLYYYVVQSVNPDGVSANSPESAGVSPQPFYSTEAPPVPIGVAVSSAVHQSVTLNWDPSYGAQYYTVYRSTLYDNGGGTSNVLNTIVLANNVVTDSFTDTSLTDGSTYSYYVTATSAGGTSGNSSPAVAVPLPSPPSSAPANLNVTPQSGQTNYFITWSAVPGAVGYIVSRGTNSSVALNYNTYVMSITETTWTDTGLSPGAQYFYMVTAVNAAGTASSSVVSGPPGNPVALGATAGNGEILLNWSGAARRSQLHDPARDQQRRGKYRRRIRGDDDQLHRQRAEQWDDILLRGSSCWHRRNERRLAPGQRDAVQHRHLRPGVDWKRRFGLEHHSCQLVERIDGDGLRGWRYRNVQRLRSERHRDDHEWRLSGFDSLCQCNVELCGDVERGGNLRRNQPDQNQCRQPDFEWREQLFGGNVSKRRYSGSEQCLRRGDRSDCTEFRHADDGRGVYQSR